MKIRQTVRHFGARRALTIPVIGDLVREKLVDLHTGVFLDRADPDADLAARREHLDALFDRTMDTYVAALEAGYPEAEAREITHVQANFDFFNHGWTEMMEFRTVEIPEAPSTPEKLDRPEHPHAEGGFADDVYVEDESGEVVVGGHAEPRDVDAGDAPGISEDDANA